MGQLARRRTRHLRGGRRSGRHRRGRANPLQRIRGAPGQLAVTATAEAEQHIKTLSGAGGLWRNSVAPRSLLTLARYRPGDAAARLRMPLLVCIAADDTETPAETTASLAERAPRGQLKVYPGTHFTFYNDPELRERVLDDQIAFFRRHLPPA
ncbi:alpha/beta hydrolase [Nonomuraea recticatena]|uniref:Alpha/beta hydrolase n=1 Tax=Nonomuraea recticatena TaxID=46178 RepID=A0ABP6EJD1_9ACTN